MAKYRMGFDEEALMTKFHTGSAQEMYHTQLFDTDVHDISPTSEYAADRIICDKNYELGEKIFEKVIALQDTNPESKTYGLWPWYAEETLEEMERPDYNMADFNAKAMIVSLYEAGDNLSQSIREKMYKSIEMACQCIINRNVDLGYTNVCIMDCFVTCAAGELMGNKKLLDYGRNKLLQFIYYTKGKGDIAEYNSPTYTIVTINDIGDFLKYLKDEEVLRYANEINHMLWNMLAQHFDYNILQLIGPQERAYADYVGAEFLSTIAKGCGIDYSTHPKFDVYCSGEMRAKYFEETRKNPKCPEDLIPYFSGEKAFGDVRKMIIDGFNFPFFEFPKAATVRRGKGYAVGSINKSEMWNQRRPLLGYIYDDKKDFSFRVKCYHDGFDFSAGGFHAVQDKSNILGSINFSENRGDTHVCIDMISGGRLVAEELKMTFEICGDTKKIKYRKENGMLILNINDVTVRINAFIKEFGKNKVEESIDITDDMFQYSIVFYKGERKTLELCDADIAMMAYTLEFEPTQDYVKPTFMEDGDMMNISWKPSDRELGLVSPKRTFTFIKNMSEDMQLLDGEPQLNEIYKKNLQEKLFS